MFADVEQERRCGEDMLDHYQQTKNMLVSYSPAAKSDRRGP
jgi:hypothetical protein